MPTDYSRSLLLASTAAGGQPEGLRERIEAFRIHLSADTSVPGVATALRVLVADLRRLPVQLSLEPGTGPGQVNDDLLRKLQRIAADIDPERLLAVSAMPPGAFHVRIGLDHADADISGIPDGHGTRLRRPGFPFPPVRHPGTGLGAVLTAAMLTGEVFKTITGLRPGTYRHIDTLDFCPVTLYSGHLLPPEHLHVERLALVGAGAIGTAVALILKALGATGELAVVDRETFELPNVITYSLGTYDDAENQLPKVDIVKSALQGMQVRRLHGTVDDLITEIDGANIQMPRIVLGAVDNVEARHDIQRIYSDLILDGGTGGRAGTTVSLHEAIPAGPCLRCYFPPHTTAPTPEQRLQQVTGLPLARIARGDQPITSDDLQRLPVEGRELLKQHLGTPVCGLARLIGLTTATGDSYRPSAAFVSQQAASLMVGALIARQQSGGPIPTRQIEYDTLYGPRPDMIDDRQPHPGCYCQASADIIQAVRAHRAGD